MLGPLRFITLAVVATSVSPVLAAEEDGFKVLCMVDFTGGDIGTKSAPTQSSCAIWCKINPNCDVASWTNYNHGTCWLKSLSKGDVKIVPNSIAASVIRRPDSPNLPALTYANMDMLGNDLGNKPASDSTACFNTCSSTDGCYAATWTGYNGGTCWMKSQGATPVSSPGAISAFVTKAYAGMYCPVPAAGWWS